MNPSRLGHCLAVAILVGLAATSESQTASEYTVTDLGSLGGGWAIPLAINSRGQVVGESATASGAIRAFLWENGSIIDLGTLGGLPEETIASGINALGQVVGASNSPTGPHAFLWDGGVMTDLGRLGGSRSIALGINDRGQVVGASQFDPNPSLGGHAFLWEDGVMTDLTTLGGNLYEARAINSRGQIIGTSFANRASLWEKGSTIDLGAFGGGISVAFALNALGQITGESRVGTGSPHAFFWRKGVMADLGSLDIVSRGYGINDLGHVVGDSNVPGSGDRHAVLWKGGVITDLNDVIPAGSGWTLERAFDINERGQIIGWDASTQRGFLLTPQ